MSLRTCKWCHSRPTHSILSAYCSRECQQADNYSKQKAYEWARERKQARAMRKLEGIQYG